MKLKTARLVTAILVAAIVIVLVVGYFLPDLMNGVLLPVLIILLIAMSVVVLTNMKCPKCGKAIRPFGQKFCAYCGEQIDWEKNANESGE